MKLIHKEEAEAHQNTAASLAIEYPMGDKDINCAVVKLTGRYPTAGRVVNLECKELGYVMQGSGKIFVEGKEIDLKEGDLISIEPGEKYYWDANVTLFVPSTPAWYPEQHKFVDV